MRHSQLFPLLAIPLLLNACRDSKIEVYQIPKEDTAVAAPAGPASGNLPSDHPAVGTMPDSGHMGFAQAQGAGLTWTAPAGWQAKPASGVRKATFVVGEGAELAVTVFPGDVGGESANVNRWRGQLGLPPASEADLAGAITRVSANGLQIAAVDLLGSGGDKPARMLGAIVPFGSSTWFFKLVGPDPVVAGAKPAFMAFLQTIKPGEGAAAAPAPAPVAPAANADMANTIVNKAEGPGLKWTAPAHWQSQPAAAMRKATYAVPGDNGAVGDLSVTAFPGDVGGELANVNRWRGQLQLAPLAAAEVEGAVTRLSPHGLNVTVVDFTGGTAEKPARMLGAIVPYDGATWFFKLTGPVDLVAKEKPAFLEFVQTLQAP